MVFLHAECEDGYRILLDKGRFAQDLHQKKVTISLLQKQDDLLESPSKSLHASLRASAVTYLKQQGFQDSEIMRVTGHSTSEIIHPYDKSSRADNASKKVNLIS